MDGFGDSVVRKLVSVRGTVQGVGFRPFVHNLASAHDLTGYVLNSGQGVTIEVQGDPKMVQCFVEEVASKAPPLAHIDGISVTDLVPAHDNAFVIRDSAADQDAFALVPPDTATCEHCRREIADPANRRYGYAFTNCTNCGPRYTIIADVPYDRPATTMSEFDMCEDCRREYNDPADRRFHAQPNACPKCGPWLELWSRNGPIATRDEALGRTRDLLGSGAILAIKGLGGFHLACDAENDASVRLLRERKRRTDKPFAVMSRGIAQIEPFAVLHDADRRLLSDPRRPIVILPRRPEARISAAVAPGNKTVAVMLPYTPLHWLLFAGDAAYAALVMTSGNLSEEPIVSNNEEAFSRLGPICDYFLIHNRRIQTRVDDSVVRVYESTARPIRRSRGYAPEATDIGMPVRQVLAVGGELKSTFCLTKDRYAILSQHIGDLENYETLVFFRETLDHMKRFFRVEPEAVAHDLHPGYLSTRFANESPEQRKIAVQHHHAHIAACAAENGLEGPVVGVAFDGTGYGADGQIWGGEFLVCDYTHFERRAHFRYVPMPGGEAAIREPWRMALAYLRDAGCTRDLGVAPKKLRVVEAMLDGRVNTVQTSSCGRLFDAVAAILGLRTEVNYEGQAAIELEAIADPSERSSYPFDLWEGEIDLRPAIRRIARSSAAPAVIAARFHNTVAACIVETARRIRESDRLNRVCLSGGSFQNWRLLNSATQRLRRAGFEVYLHRKVPANDGGLSLGQAVIANAVLAAGQR